MIKKPIIMVFLPLSDYQYFLEDLIVSSYFLPGEHEKRERHLAKGQEKCYLGLHVYTYLLEVMII